MRGMAILWITIQLVLAFGLFGCTPKRIVTNEEYNQIALGMTYQEVVKIIGTEGKEILPTTQPQYNTPVYSNNSKAYEWVEADGSRTCCIFNEGKLVDITKLNMTSS